MAGRTCVAFPFLAVHPLVFSEHVPQVDAAGPKGLTAEVVEEGVGGDQQSIPGCGGAAAEVVILEAADAESLVEKPNPWDDLAADEEGEADQPVRREVAAVVDLAVLPGETVEPGQIVVAGADLLRAADVVRYRTDQADVGAAV